PKNLGEVIEEFMRRMKGTASLRIDATEALTKKIEAQLRSLKSYNDPQGVYARLPFLLEVN
ncbi:MAG: hypothetical protein IT582_09835, partial [Opitutaceae bacterium]|nr:hypothetical protein [Opitutaceae bacterium]